MAKRAPDDTRCKDCPEEKLPDRARCAACAETHRAQMAARRVEHRKRRRCLTCSAPAAKGRHHCAYHLGYFNRANQAWRKRNALEPSGRRP
jgi:hypothetical protein